MKTIWIASGSWEVNQEPEYGLTLSSKICSNFRNQGPYSQYFIFFLTYEWAQQAWALYYNWLKRLPSDKTL
jgi:hypothetical protein